MKAKSDKNPGKFKIEKDKNVSTIHFFEQIEEVETDEGVEYEYDHHELKVHYDPGLETHVEDNYEDWLDKAKKKEVLPKQISEIERIESIEEVINSLLGL